MMQIVWSATHAVPNASRVPKYGSRAELDGTHYQALNFRKSSGSEPARLFSAGACFCAITRTSRVARRMCLAHNSDGCRAANEKIFYFGARDGGRTCGPGDWAGREPLGIAARDKSSKSRRALCVICVRIIGREPCENYRGCGRTSRSALCGPPAAHAGVFGEQLGWQSCLDRRVEGQSGVRELLGHVVPALPRGNSDSY